MADIVPVDNVMAVEMIDCRDDTGYVETCGASLEAPSCTKVLEKLATTDIVHLHVEPVLVLKGIVPVGGKRHSNDL